MHAAQSSKTLALALACIALVISQVLISIPPPAKAAISACSASLDRHEVQPNVNDIAFNFTLTNDNSVDIKWFRITKPFSGLTTVGVVQSGWRKTTQGGATLFTDGTLSPGNSVAPRITVDVGDIAGSSGNWVIEVSDDPGGASPFACSGSLGLTVSSGAPDVSPPQISGVAVSGITASSAKVSWTTNEPATSRVEYGLETDAYSISKNNSTLTRSHSLTVTEAIAASTTYYYRVCSTDAAGNPSCSSENSFTTSAVTSTPTPSPTPAPTPTPTPTPTPADSTLPNVRLTTNFSKPFEQAPRIKGEAVDNKVIKKIEYSTDGGVNWLPVNELDKPGGKSTGFSFTPTLFDDGNYKIVVRAVDGSGNWGVSKTYTLIIDRLPPTVGSVLISVGPLVLTPNQDGNLVTVSGIEHRITLSAVGGPTSIDLLVDGHMHSLSRSSETGLWNGAVIFDQLGSYELTVKSKDGAGNITERRLTNVVVLKPGTVEAGEEGTITVYYQEPTSKVWRLWDAKSFSQTNPQSFKDGTYKFFLPPGVYYLRVESPGYKTVTSNIFQLDAPAPINTNFTLEKPSRINIFNISFISKEIAIQETQDSFEENSLLDKPAPIFFLPALEGTFESVALRGRPSVLSFVNTWSGPSVEQISILDKFPRPNQLGTIIVQENPSRAKIFAERGEYDLNLAIDQEGQLVDDFNIFTLPTHIFLDRKGVIKRVVPGVLNVEEIEEILLEVFRELLEY